MALRQRSQTSSLSLVLRSQPNVVHGSFIRTRLCTQPHFNAPRRYLEVTLDLRTTANLGFYDMVGDGGGPCGTSSLPYTPSSCCLIALMIVTPTGISPPSAAMGMSLGIKAVHQHCPWMKIEITDHNYPPDLAPCPPVGDRWLWRTQTLHVSIRRTF
jgi:hypothetical protein